MISIFKCITLLNYKRFTCKQEIPSRTGVFASNRSYPSLLMRKKDLENTVERLAFWFMTIMRNLTAFTGLLRLEIDFNFSVSWLIKIVFRVVSQTSENVLYVSDRWFRFRWCVTHALGRHVSWQVTSEWPMRLYNLQTYMNLKTLLLHPTGSTCRWSRDAKNRFAAGLRVDISWGRQWKNHNEI